MKTWLTGAALAAAVLGAVAVGATFGAPTFAVAQDAETDTPDAEDGEPAPVHGGPLQDVLAPLVDDGTINQAQADAVIRALEEVGPRFGPRGFGPGGFGPGGFGPGGHGPAGFGPVASLETASEALGTTPEELHEALEGGSSVADVAAERGVEVQVVIDALVADAESQLDEAVADGRLTEDEAATRLAEVTERITEFINGEIELRERGFGGPPGLGAPRFFSDDDDDGA